MKPFNEHGPQEIKEHKVGGYALHGDVILFMVAEQPADFAALPKEKNDALAYGELTGHVHKIIGEPGDFELKVDEAKQTRHLRVVRPVTLKHQEHSPIKLPPGDYRIGIQREYDPFTKLIRPVVD